MNSILKMATNFYFLMIQKVRWYYLANKKVVSCAGHMIAAYLIELNPTKTTSLSGHAMASEADSVQTCQL
jgi:hypothetical protein